MGQYLKILTIINCIAAVHGMFLSFILVTKKRNQKANHFLALMVLLFSIGMLGAVYISSGFYRKIPWLSPFFNALPYTFGPLLFLYIRALTRPQVVFSRLDVLHALPTVLGGLYYSSIYFMTVPEQLAFLDKIYFETSLATYFSIVLSLVQGLVYIVLCLGLFRAHSRKIKESYSALEKINLSWMRHLVILFIVTWLIAVGMQSFLPDKLIEAKLDDAVTYFLISLFIFTIGYRGLSQPEIFSENEREPQGQDKTRKYEKTGLSTEKSVSIKEELLQWMEKCKLYLDPGLTLLQVANQMGVPLHQLSQVINDSMEQNFYRFINGYRIKEAMRRMTDPETCNDKLIKIAFDSGFNSLSTFNRVFKDINDESPTQFKNKGISRK